MNVILWFPLFDNWITARLLSRLAIDMLLAHITECRKNFMGIEALEGLYLTYTVYLLVFVGTELAGCFNNNNINDDNSPHCFVNRSWKWDANWACTRRIRSYKHLRWCNKEFPDFYLSVSGFILVSLPPVLLLSASIPKPQQTSSPTVVLVIWCKYTPNVLFIFYFCWHWRVLFMLCVACNNRTSWQFSYTARLVKERLY